MYCPLSHLGMDTTSQVKHLKKQCHLHDPDPRHIQHWQALHSGEGTPFIGSLLKQWHQSIPTEMKMAFKKGPGRTIQRLPHPWIHPIYNHQTQTLLHMSERFCLQDPDIALSHESMPMPGKHRSGCSQSSIEWNTEPPMEELEKVPKELKGSATL